jgi:hypothetical protein
MGTALEVNSQAGFLRAFGMGLAQIPLASQRRRISTSSMFAMLRRPAIGSTF